MSTLCKRSPNNNTLKLENVNNKSIRSVAKCRSVFYLLFSFRLFIYLFPDNRFFGILTAIVRRRQSGLFEIKKITDFFSSHSLNEREPKSIGQLIVQIKTNDTCTLKHEKVLFNTLPLFTSLAHVSDSAFSLNRIAMEVIWRGKQHAMQCNKI